MRLIDFSRRGKTPEAPAIFFCPSCRCSFFYSELERLAAHLKPHDTEAEAEARVRRAEPAMEG
jgi:hypothetical protein